MSAKKLSSAVAGASAFVSLLFAATSNFVPDLVFRESSLAGARTIGGAAWSANKGEITATPKGQDGGWLVLDKSYQDIQFYTEFRCAARCDAGVLLRSEKTSAGGWKGIYVPLSEDDSDTYELTLSAEGKELSRNRLPVRLRSSRAWR